MVRFLGHSSPCHVLALFCDAFDSLYRSDPTGAGWRPHRSSFILEAITFAVPSLRRGANERSSIITFIIKF